MPELFLVGGAVRDIQLKVLPSDYDFTVEAESYAAMKNWLMREFEVEIFLEKPEYGTIRGLVSIHKIAGHLYPPHVSPKRMDLAVDFVLARKDGAYSDGRRPDSVEPGTLADDLARRDFTVNAMAIDSRGMLVDPYNGSGDLTRGRLAAVGDPVDRLTEDALRAARAVRFMVTKGLNPDSELALALEHKGVLYALQYYISEERVRAELLKAFKHDTLRTLKVLGRFPLLRAVLLGANTNLWLKPTLEQ